MYKKFKLHANKYKSNKIWYDINHKVQLARDSLEMTRGCRRHATTMTPLQHTP